MKVGDLIKHKKTATTALILNIYMTEHLLEYRNEEWVEVLFSGELAPSKAPLKLLKDNWKTINEI